MRSRLASTASSTAKSVRSIIGDAVTLQKEPPTKYELTCGICARGASVPLAVAAFVCLIVDWQYALQVGRDWSNTFLAIALIFSFLLNSFLFGNMMLKIIGHPSAVNFRRYFAVADVIVIALLITGVVERLQGPGGWDRSLYYGQKSPTGVQMLVVTFCLVLSFGHLVAGSAMATAAIRNWLHVQKLTPEEYNDYKLGVRPLHPPPAYNVGTNTPESRP